MTFGRDDNEKKERAGKESQMVGMARRPKRLGLVGIAAAVLVSGVLMYAPQAASQDPDPQTAAGCYRNSGEQFIRFASTESDCGSHETFIQLGGAPGPSGPPGADGVPDLQYVRKETGLERTTQKQVSAACPTGTKIVGGGHHLQNYDSGRPPPGVIVQGSFPDGAEFDTAWTVRAGSTTVSEDRWSITAWAVCAKPATTT
jgi:hypothetical protein